MIIDNGTTIHLKRTFNTDLETLFNCFRSSEAWKSWWLGLDVMKLDFHEGGEIKFSWKHSKAKKHGKIMTLKQNKILSFTWDSGDFPHDPNDECTIPVKDTLVTFKFSKVNDQQSNLELIHQLKTTDNNVNGHYEGWTWAMLDLDKKFNASRRKGLIEHEVKLERIFNVPVERMYELWIKDELIRKWFNSSGSTRGQSYAVLKVDNCIAFDWEDVDGKISGIEGAVFRHIGEFKEIIPNKKLVFSWVDSFQHYESIVTVDFIAQGNTTKVKLVHNNFHNEKNIKEYQEGWTHCFDAQEKILNL